VRRCNAQLQQAEVTIRELSFELDDLSSLSEHLQASSEAADAAAAAARGDLESRARVHRLEIEAIKQEAEKGVVKLRHTFNETLEQTKAVLTSEMDMLRAKLVSKTRDFEHAISSEEECRSELDSAAATIADLNRMLVEERANARHKHAQLQHANARLMAQLADKETQIEEYEKVIEYTAKSLIRRHRANYPALQAIQAQVDLEKLAVAEVERSASSEIRSVRAAALKNFEEQQTELSRAWELVESERAQVREQSAELQRLSVVYEAKERASSERIQSLLEQEKAALENEWVQVKELQRESRQKQAVLEDKLASLDLQEEQRDM
jgi:hypothetical protein